MLLTYCDPWLRVKALRNIRKFIALESVSMRPITKFLTDMDGVLIDSEQLAMRVMDECGVNLIKEFKPDAVIETDYIYRTYPGTSTNKIVELLIKEFDLDEGEIRCEYDFSDGANVADEIAKLITQATIERFQAELKAVPGAAESYRQIREAFGAENFGLATTSPAGRMDVSLAHATDPVTGENAGFEEIFPEGDLRRSGYLFDNKYDDAFGALGWDPAETAIVEDSVSGVTKAKAGRPDVRVIGTVAALFYENKGAQSTALLKAGADIVVSDMEDLPRALKWLDNGLDPHNAPAFKSIVYLPTDNDNPLGYSRTPSYGAPKGP